MASSYSLLQQARLKFQPQLPPILQDLGSIGISKDNLNSHQGAESLKDLFPQTNELPILHFQAQEKKKNDQKKLKIGVVLSGGQAPGGHNVIGGLFDALKELNPSSELFGFLQGPRGILENRTKEITKDLLTSYRNQGGFDLIGSGRDKIENPEQFKAAEATVLNLQLNGLVIIGGDDSNTNAALLAEYFLSRQVPCSVIGVPKTIDGDLKNDFIEISFGFDTACKIYSEIIGNIARDTLSSKKYYYFIKLMGRSASHITVECALQTHPNIVLVGEEIEAQRKTLRQVTDELCDVICERSLKGKDYGMILIPEGIVEFIPEFKLLISELNHLLAPNLPHAQQIESLSSDSKTEYLARYLSAEALSCFRSLPANIQAQLLLERDPHGNVQISKIETERLFIDTVTAELKKRKSSGSYKGKFNALPHFCGYEGRSGMPSNFDSQYCYSLGFVAALLTNCGASGYMSCVKNLNRPVSEWKICGIPLVSMMHMESRNGKNKPVIRKALVELKGKPFLELQALREGWKLSDDYQYIGPIQFFGPSVLTEPPVISLNLEKSSIQ